MAKFSKKTTTIQDLLIIEPTVYEDERGFFLESYNREEFKEIGLNTEFIQDNHSRSHKGVLRGLHFQAKHPQGKLVRVTLGAVYDVAVDLRKGSPTYCKYFGLILSEKNKLMFYIPKGFAHGFLTLTEKADLIYKVTDPYCSRCDSGILWNDPNLDINWPLEEYNIREPVLSKKDSKLLKLQEHDITFYFKTKSI
ncbi:MAG: dTDP-4-dehydrorhamnose 3,5-epimerase [Candidatus Heimdallarchaeaceae archaeon]